MANPLNTLAKPAAFGVRQVIGLTQGALRAGKSLVSGLSGGDEPGPPPEPEREAQRKPPARRRSSRPKPLDDVSITRKVETEIFRDPKIPKGSIDVNTVDGVVWLRGEAKTPEMIKRLERETKAVPEVKRVENLLHLPKTPAPSRTDTPAPQRKTRRTRQSPGARKVTSKRVTAERHPRAGEAEPAARELADERRGRQPAPLSGTEGTPSEPPEAS